MLTRDHVVKAANEVENLLRTSPGVTLRDAVTECWELDRAEIDQVVSELRDRGWCTESTGVK